MGRSGYPTERGNWRGRGSPCKSKNLKFPLVLDKNITYWEIPRIRKKGISNSFRKLLTAASVQFAFSYTIMTKPHNTTPCPAGLSPKIICQASSFLPKMSQNCSTHQVWTVRLPLNFMGNPGDGEKSYPTAKNLLIFPIIKIPLNRFKSFFVKSFISSTSNNNFQVIILCNLHL